MRHWAEAVARSYLESRGYRTLAENYAVRGGELDLVMRCGEQLIFVEVRQRRSVRYGHPLETIDARKVARLRRTALIFTVTRFGRDDLPTRFDAVLLLGTRRRYRLEHHRGIL